MFDDEFIENLPQENWEAIKEVKNCFNDWDAGIPDDQEVGYYEEYLKAFAFLNSFLQRINFMGEKPQLSLKGTSKNNGLRGILSLCSI